MLGRHLLGQGIQERLEGGALLGLFVQKEEETMSASHIKTCNYSNKVVANLEIRLGIDNVDGAPEGQLRGQQLKIAKDLSGRLGDTSEFVGG